MGAFKELFMKFREEQNEETESFSDWVDEQWGFKPVGKPAPSVETAIRKAALGEPLKAKETNQPAWILFLDTPRGRLNKDWFFSETAKDRAIKNLKKRNEYKYLPKGSFNIEIRHEQRIEVV